MFRKKDSEFIVVNEIEPTDHVYVVSVNDSARFMAFALEYFKGSLIRVEAADFDPKAQQVLEFYSNIKIKSPGWLFPHCSQTLLISDGFIEMFSRDFISRKGFLNNSFEIVIYDHGGLPLLECYDGFDCGLCVNVDVPEDQVNALFENHVIEKWDLVKLDS